MPGSPVWFRCAGRDRDRARLVRAGAARACRGRLRRCRSPRPRQRGPNCPAPQRVERDAGRRPFGEAAAIGAQGRKGRLQGRTIAQPERADGLAGMALHLAATALDHAQGAPANRPGRIGLQQPVRGMENAMHTDTGRAGSSIRHTVLMQERRPSTSRSPSSENTDGLALGPARDWVDPGRDQCVDARRRGRLAVQWIGAKTSPGRTLSVRRARSMARHASFSTCTRSAGARPSPAASEGGYRGKAGADAPTAARSAPCASSCATDRAAARY